MDRLMTWQNDQLTTITETGRRKLEASLGCILLGLFWLFLFRFRNNRIHGISISKRTLTFWKRNTHGGDPGEPLYLHTRGQPRRISRQKFPKRTRILSIPSKPHSFHSVHSAIGSRMNGMIFRSFRKRNSSQKNTNTVYSEYSYSGIVPKERTLDSKTLLNTSCLHERPIRHKLLFVNQT